MHTSYDEIRRMAFRALDAGGAAAGIDEDTAHAIAWLEAAGLPGLTILADALDASPPASRADGLRLSRQQGATTNIEADRRSAVFFAASVVDLLIGRAQTSTVRTSVIELQAAAHPLVLAASAARYCPDDGVISVQWPDAEVHAAHGHAFLTAAAGHGANWSAPMAVDVVMSCRLDGDPPDSGAGRDLGQLMARALRDGIDVDDQAHARVAAYAAKILVPETEGSRETGAGAGLTDND